MSESLVDAAGGDVPHAQPNVLPHDAPRALPDVVGPNMRLLLVGLNPSPTSAARIVAYAKPGNRFWPAAIAAGIVSRDRDPAHALAHHGVGFTDLVARVTARADQVTREEFRFGAEHVRAIVMQLRPRTVCFVGLSGYRAAVDRHAVAGWQLAEFGGVPTYVMPNPSGINAHTTVADLAAHLAIAAAGRDRFEQPNEVSE